MKKLYTLIFILLVGNSLSAQYNTNQNKVWTFGRHAGLDFTSGAPVPFTSSFYDDEGGACVSDALGNLLFYTDGKRVWNKTGSLMPSGSSIVPYTTFSTNQSSVIIPVLNNPNQYYVFSLGYYQVFASPCILTYSIVDMTLAGGLGDVVPSATGVYMDSVLGEKMIAVRGDNCNIWLIVHESGSANFLSYEITAAGVSSIPVVSAIGTFPTYQLGAIKVSPDRQKIVNANYRTTAGPAAGVELYDFNAATGVISNCRVLNTYINCYGAEFSSDNTKLYISNATSTRKLLQYDISLPTLPSIIASEFTVATGVFSIMKLAPDDKIYITPIGYTFVDRINSPNLAGSACNYASNAVSIFPDSSMLSLPNLFWSVSSSSPSPITGSTTLCQGATTALSNAMAGGIWSSSNTGVATVTSAGVVTGVSSGTSVISYSTGCAITTTTVTVNPAPQAITGATTICAGNMSVLSSSPTGGTWSSSNSSAATVSGSGTVSGATPGTTVISYTLAGGCAVSVSVTVNAAPSAISGTTQVCTGATTNLSNTVSGGTWSSGATGIATVSNAGVVTGVAAGTAIISYTTGAGCTKTATVTVNPTPGVISGNTVVCGGATTTLSNAVGGGTWSSSATGVATVSNTGVITGITTGKSVISYTNNCGQATVTVTVTSPPGAITGTMSLCAGGTTALSNSAAGGTWSSMTTSVAVVNGAGVITGVSAGTAVIRYQNICGIATATVTVSAGAQPVTGSATVCVGATIMLSNSNTGGTWSSSATGVATVSSAGVVTGVSAGTTTISYTVVAGICGAVTATKTITVTAPPVAGLITGDTSLCAGATLFLSDIVTGGMWSSGNVAIATVSAGGTVTGVSVGTVAISYTIANSCGTSTAVKNITVHALPAAGVISGITPVCKGAVITLSETVTGGAWSSSNTATATVSAAGSVHAVNTGATTISYTVTSPAGCSSTATYTVTVNNEAAFTINGTVTQPHCYGDRGSISITISGGTPPFDYLWSTGSVATTIANLAAGPYTVNVKEHNTQCEKNDSFRITMPDTLTATTAVTSDKCDAGQGSASVEVAGGTTPYGYAWSNNATSKDIAGLHAGTYSVIVTDAHDCTQYTTATITDTCNELTIHDVITPNGDGINDMWVIEGLSLYPNNSVHIFDKWGDVVYEQTNYRNNWNGAGKSGVLPDGTYYYLVKLEATGVKSEQVFTGAVMIKR